MGFAIPLALLASCGDSSSDDERVPSAEHGGAGAEPGDAGASGAGTSAGGFGGAPEGGTGGAGKAGVGGMQGGAPGEGGVSGEGGGPRGGAAGEGFAGEGAAGEGAAGGIGGDECVTAGAIIIGSEAELRAFAARRCEIVDGSLWIQSSNLQNLDGLGDPSPLRVITGDLWIDRNFMLENIEGLRGLERIGGLRIEYNAIEDLDGLESLRIAGYDDGTARLLIEDNVMLTSLSALHDVASSFTTVTVIRNDRLTNLAGIDHVLTLDALELSGNIFLSNVEFPNLEVSSVVHVYDSPRLLEVRLPSLRLAGMLNFRSNDRLTSINMPSLTSVQDLVVSGNQLLTTLGMGAIAKVAALTIWNNPMLPQCFVDALDARFGACTYFCGGNDLTATCN